MTSFLITPSVQHYHWGKRGKQSRVASLVDSVDPAKAYAEAWYGDHEKAPSIIRKTKETLRNRIAASPVEMLGERIVNTFGSSLPFLFKVLSVDAPLSIQVHPSKEQASGLHAKDPVNYPDTNHKPEIVVALSEFEVLSGFKSPRKIQEAFEFFPEMGLILGKELSAKLQSISESNRSDLSEIVKQFYATDPGTLQRVVALIVDRLERAATTEISHKLFLQLVHRGFEADPGVFVALFLNHKVLQPGEAMFTPARVLHAYLKGDAIECMANSDNVVRAGLTPKHQDVPALLDVVDWSGEAEPTFFAVNHLENDTGEAQVLRVPTTEFMLYIYRDWNEPLGKLGPVGSPELLVLLDGVAQTSQREKMEIGDAFFIPADCAAETITCQKAFIVRVCVP